MSNKLFELFRALKLAGALKKLEELMDSPKLFNQFAVEELLETILEAELFERKERKKFRLMRAAKLKNEQARVEDIDYSPERGLEEQAFKPLITCDWVRRKLHLVLTGATGTGKTLIANALGVEAIEQDYTICYKRMPPLLDEIEQERAEGTWPNFRAKLAKFDLLIIDDWAIAPLATHQRLDLLEIIEDRTDRGSLILTSQLPVDKWHQWIGDPTVADAILDRIVHRAYHFNLKGESQRKKRSIH